MNQNMEKYLQELCEIYEFYKNAESLVDSGSLPDADENGNFYSVPSMTFKYLLKYYGFDSQPKVVSNDEYYHLDTSEMFHGFQEYDHGVNFLQDNDYHFGNGKIYGFYGSWDDYTAEKYTATFFRNPYDADKGKVLGFKVASNNYATRDQLDYLLEISPDNYENIDDERVREKMQSLKIFYSKLQESGENVEEYSKWIKNFIASDMSCFAVYLGFDYLYNAARDERIVYNRGKVVVTQNSIDRFNEGASERA